jgi:hypothetical protein
VYYDHITLLTGDCKQCFASAQGIRSRPVKEYVMKTSTIIACTVGMLAVTIAPPGGHAHAANMQKVDLRSFFYGTPPAPPKAPPPTALAVITTAPGVTNDARIEDFFRAFATALKARDGKSMLARLSDKYRIDGLPDDQKPADFFEQAVERIPGPTEMVIKSITLKDAIRSVQIDVRYGPDLVKTRNFKFDAQTRLLWSDLFRLQTQTHGT